MRTINTIISETRSLRQARMENLRDDRIASAYRKFPELERIDTVLFTARRNNLLRVIQNQIDVEAVIDDNVKHITETRNNFLNSHNIPLDFDELIPECKLCNDTGFVKKKSLTVVCNCMSQELIEAYNEAGLSDYNSVLPNNFKPSYIPKSADRRTDVHKSLVKILNSISEGKSHSVYIYSDGAQTGKTFLSVVITKIAITLGLSAVYVKCEDILNYSDDSIDGLKHFDLLIIDDYVSGVTRMRNLAGTLNSILEARKNRGLATVIVSNETKIEMVENSDERIAGKLSSAIDI